MVYMARLVLMLMGNRKRRGSPMVVIGIRDQESGVRNQESGIRD
jgi:hypothetical protein